MECRSSTQRIISPTMRWFYYFISCLDVFIAFSCSFLYFYSSLWYYIAEQWQWYHSPFAHYCRGISFNLSPFNAGSFGLFTQALDYIQVDSRILEQFMRRRCFSEALSASIDMMRFAIPSTDTLIHFHMLSDKSIVGVNPPWSWCIGSCQI